VPNQGVPSLLTDEQAAQLIFDTAADVRERDWAKATEKLEMLRFAVCIDSSPISNPFIERALRTPVPPSGVSLVALAVANGADRTFVETLVSWGADPHGKVSGNLKRGKDTDLSLLHLAMANNHLHLVPLLLQVGVQANGLSGCGYDPLAYFCATHTGAYLEQESVARVFRELFESGASFASRNPSGVSTMELLAKRAPPALFEMCLSLEAQRAEEHAVSPFTAGELRRWALKALADSTPYGTRSLESLSKLMDHTAETGAEVEGAASTISDILRGSVIGDSTDVVLGLSRELPLLERLLQDISGHPTLFSADSVAAALNTKLSGPGLQPTILATCLEYVSVYHRTSSNLVALALQLGADPNAEIGSSAITLYGVEVTPNTLLDKALAFGDLKVADLLIAHGADVAELQRPDQLQRAISEQVATIVSEDVIFEWLLEPTFEGGLYPEEHPFIIAAAYPHLFAAGHGVDSIEDILLPRFQSLDRNLKIKIASQNPELAFLPALLPDGTNLKVEQIRRFLVNATQFDEEKGAKQSASSAATSLLALPYQELLLQCIKEARLPEARLLLMNDCPIPRAYFEGRNPAELTHDEVSAIRHRMIEQCEKLSTLLFDNKPLPNTCKELQSEWYPLKSRSWQAQQSLTGHHLVMTVLKAHGDLKDAILLATALKALQMRPAQQSSIDPHGRALAELLPKLLYRYPLHVITDVLRIVEFQVDDRRSATPILAEAFAAFHHPEAIEALRELSRSTHPLRDPQSIGVLTAAISSFTNFIVYGKQVSGTAIHVWRTIANITHGHRRYRFETKPLEPSGSHIYRRGIPFIQPTSFTVEDTSAPVNEKRQRCGGSTIMEWLYATEPARYSLIPRLGTSLPATPPLPLDETFSPRPSTLCR
jgi:hypothetical protein